MSNLSYSQADIRELIDYDPETGICRWKPRDAKWFNPSPGSIKTQEHLAKWWNNRFAGTVISSVNANGYLSIGLDEKRINLHRVIWFYMTGEWPEKIDHIDGNGLNNKWLNLREVDHIKNMRNLKRYKTNKSGIPGVMFHSRDKKWYVTIGNGKQRTHIGVSKNLDEAIEMRRQAEIKYEYHENHGR